MASGSAVPSTLTCWPARFTVMRLTPGTSSSDSRILRAQPPQVAPLTPMVVRVSPEIAVCSLMTAVSAAAGHRLDLVPVFDQAAQGLPVRTAIRHVLPGMHGIGHAVAQLGQLRNLLLHQRQLAGEQIPHQGAG